MLFKITVFKNNVKKSFFQLKQTKRVADQETWADFSDLFKQREGRCA